MNFTNYSSAKLHLFSYCIDSLYTKFCIEPNKSSCTRCADNILLPFKDIVNVGEYREIRLKFKVLKPLLGLTTTDLFKRKHLFFSVPSPKVWKAFKNDTKNLIKNNLALSPSSLLYLSPYSENPSALFMIMGITPKSSKIYN